MSKRESVRITERKSTLSPNEVKWKGKRSPLNSFSGSSIVSGEDSDKNSSQSDASAPQWDQLREHSEKPKFTIPRLSVAADDSPKPKAGRLKVLVKKHIKISKTAPVSPIGDDHREFLIKGTSAVSSERLPSPLPPDDSKPPPPFKVVWKPDPNALQNPNLLKDIPITTWYQSKRVPFQWKPLLEGFVILLKAFKSQPLDSSKETLINMMHTLSSLFTDESLQRELANITLEILPDELLQWTERLEIVLMQVLNENEMFQQDMMRDISKLEEENLFFKDFVDQHTHYTPNRTVEIQVKQYLKPVELSSKVNSFYLDYF